MALSQKIVQKQSQTLNFTIQLRPAIALLELSNLDLQLHVDQQILENPFLEREAQASQDGPEEEAADSEGTPALSQDDSDKETLYEEMGSEDYDNVWTSDRRLTSNYDRSGTNDLSGLENIAAQEITLRDHLLSQINTDIDSEQDRLIAFALLEFLDDTGYMTTPLSVLSESLGAPLSNIERVVTQLKRFDPVGIFAHSLRECLSLQLEERGLLDQKTTSILEFIDLFAEAKIQDLLVKSRCTAEELKEVIATLRQLDPKPGLKFQNALVQTLVPDVFVREDKQKNIWTVTLNSQTLPKVLVTQDYQVRAGLNFKKDKELRKYYQERMGEANWLVRALDQRAQNILKVVQELVVQQKGFFEKGVTAFKPMNLRQVAEAIGVHESTVSRITQNKYLHCPQGTFELRYFFSASITNAWTGEDQSALTIQHTLKQLIQEEDPSKPYSDDMLVFKLGEKDIDIARRTISKYRELLKIPSSYERKRRHLRDILKWCDARYQWLARPV